MKKIKAVVFLCVSLFFAIVVIDFIFKDNVQKNINEIKQGTEDIMEEKNKDASLEEDEEKNTIEDTETAEDVWEKIASKHIEGAKIYDIGEKAAYDGLEYQVLEASITKKRRKQWDYVPDFPQYKYDKKDNLINEYSYVYIKIKICCGDNRERKELYLNNIGLHIYDKNGEKLGSNELCSAALGKRESKNYFQCFIDEEKALETELVYIMEDEWLGKGNIYILEADNRGVMPEKKEDICLLKVPVDIGK